MLGPGPPPKKGGSKTGSTRALNTGGMGSSIGSRGDSSTVAGSSPTMVEGGSRLSGEGWNIKRYQREDEELWGHEHDKQHTGQRFVDAIVRAGSDVRSAVAGSRLLNRSKEIEEDPDEDTGSYYITRNPPVNDLHPPVVSTHTHKDATQWMLQPPPPAKVMEGKQRATRSRADSGASGKHGQDDPSVSRQISSRLMDSKLARGESPSSDLAFRSYTPSKSKSRQTSSAAKHTTQSSCSDSSDGGIRRKKRPPPIFTNSSTDSLASDRVVHNPVESSKEKTREKKSRSVSRPGSRPGLNTIPSSSMEVPKARAPAKTEASGLGEEVRLKSPRQSASRRGSVTQREDSPSRPEAVLLTPNKNAMPVTLMSVDSSKGNAKENVGFGGPTSPRRGQRWSMDL